MNPFHRIVSTTTVNTIVEDVYDVVEPTTGTVDASRRDGAARALRMLNPSLPQNEASVDPQVHPYVRLRPIHRTPWRVPPMPAGLRTDLVGIGVRNVETLARVTVAWLMDKLPGTPVQAEVERIKNIARLMRVSGLDRETAAYFHDDVVNPIQTPRELGEADQGIIRDLVNAHCTAGFPDALGQEKPWRLWQMHGSALTSQRRRARMAITPLPYRESRALDQASRWREAEASAQRTQAQRESATSIRWLYEVQSDLLRANQCVLRKRGPEAFQAYLSLWQRLGEQAVEEGLVDGNSKEATGPSVETVLGVCWRVLDRIDEGDAADARIAITSSPPPEKDGLASFGIADLQDQHGTTVRSALRPHGAKVVGASGLSKLKVAFSERKGSTLAQPLLQGIETPNASAQAADYGEADCHQLQQNLYAVDIGTLQDSESEAWSIVEQAFVLRDVRMPVGSCLDGQGGTPLASDVLKPEVVGSFPASLTSSMGPFDRFVSHSASRATKPMAFLLPLTEQFPTRYRLDVLAPLYTSRDSSAWNYSSADFADPVRFGFILPQLIARHVLLGMARSLTYMGRYRVAAAVRQVARSSASATGSAMTTKLSDMVSEGTVSADNMEVDCSLFGDEEEELYEALHALNLQADQAYQQGDLETAASCYSQVIAAASQCSEVWVSKYLGDADDLRADLKTRMEVHDGTIDALSLLKYMHIETGDPDIGTPYFGNVIIWETGDWFGTYTMAAKASRYSWDATTVMAEVQYQKFFSFDSSSPAIERSSSRTDTDDEENALVAGSFAGSSLLNGAEAGYARELVSIESDRIIAEALHASSYLYQLEQGLNWLGFDPNFTPIWDYSWLLSQARYYAEKADALQQRTMSVLDQAEATKLEELQAIAAAATSAQGLSIARAQYDMAQSQLGAAEVSYDVAEDQADNAKDDWIWVVVAVAAAAVATVATAGAAGVVITGAVVAGAAASSAAASASQVDQACDNKEAADGQVEIAQANVVVAQSQVVLAQEQVALAALESAFAQALLEEVMDDTLNGENLFLIVDILEKVAGNYLQMANRLSWLAERALQLESRRATSYIQMSYHDPEEVPLRFTGAARLLNDLDGMEHARVTGTTNRYQLIKTTFSLMQFDPASLFQLQDRNSCLFRISQQSLDERFPGLYLHSVKRIEVEFDGLVPSEGVQALLRTASNSMVRVPFDSEYVSNECEVDYDWAYPESDFLLELGSGTAPRYALKGLWGSGFVQSLSEYSRSADSIVLAAPEGALDTFEHLGVDNLWMLELPRSGNPFDVANIVDVRITLYFTAEYDQALADQQRDVLDNARVTRAVMLPATQYAADSFATIAEGPPDTSYRDLRLLRFEVSDDILPANLDGRAIHEVLLCPVQAGQLPITLHLRATANPKPLAATTEYGTSKIEGMAYSAVHDRLVEYQEDTDDDGVPDTTVTYHQPRTGDFPDLDAFVSAVCECHGTSQDIAGTWSIKVLPEDNPNLYLLDDDGDPVTVASGALPLGSGQGALHGSGSWKHVELTTRVKLTDTSSTLLVTLRDDGVGNKVFATLSSSATSIGDGTNSWPAAPIADVIVPGVWTEVSLRVTKDALTLLLDGVEVAASSGSLAVTAAGSFGFSCTGGSCEISDARATRLRYDGTTLEDVVSETFESDANAWNLSGGAAWAPRSHNILDLSFLQDFLLQLDYTADFDFVEPTPVS